MMTTLSKETKNNWYEWQEEYKRALIDNRYQIELGQFTLRHSKYLLKNSLYSFLSITLNATTLKDLKEFYNFCSQVDNFKNLCIKEVSCDERNIKDEELFLIIQDLYFKHSFSFN
mmetsp:Transcript_26482/g.23425  ORF Transcript_26482/g.23425 Transcript_26482/m.23425 type:complete len:115 (+) Transcript_26482:85-429(+)